MTPQAPDDIAALSYEAALAQLDALIQKLEGGSIPLEDAITAYERGVRLARHCEELLDRTERRVSALVVGGDGRTAEAPLQIDPPGAADTPAPRGSGQTGPRAPGGPADAGDTLFGRVPPRHPAPGVDPDDVPF